MLIFGEISQIKPTNFFAAVLSTGELGAVFASFLQ